MAFGSVFPLSGVNSPFQTTNPAFLPAGSGITGGMNGGSGPSLANVAPSPGAYHPPTTAPSGSSSGGGSGFGSTSAGIVRGAGIPIGGGYQAPQTPEPAQPSSGSSFDPSALMSLLSQAPAMPSPSAPVSTPTDTTPTPEAAPASPALASLQAAGQRGPSEGWAAGGYSSTDAPWLGKRNPPVYTTELAGRRVY
jgi:hypothetical protein